MKRTTIIGASAIAALLLASAFLGGIVFAQAVDWQGPFRKVPEPRPSVARHVSEVARILGQQALTPATEASMTAGAVQGILDSLDDPYAIYFDEEHFQFFNEHTEGDFGGIGVNISDRDGEVFVVSVMEGTPAEKAGVLAEDVFVSINGVKRDRWTSDEVVKRVRGEEGTEVKIGMRREGAEEIVYFTIERAKIEIPNVMSRVIDGEVGYIRLLTFNQKSAGALAEEIETLKADGVRGFVIDLRDNPGGLLSSSVEVASLFVEEGPIVLVEERDQPRYEHRASGGVVTDAPLVVLVNANSASASEVLAGALQDYGRAVIVGMKTFGKGSVQTIEELSFGGAMKFTIAHYLTPEGRNIDAEGIQPDIVVEMDPAQQADEADDIQLERAVEELKRQLR